MTSPAPRRTRWFVPYVLAVAGAGGTFLVLHRPETTARAIWTTLLLYVALSIVIKRLGFHIAQGVTHSLVGIVDLAALFSLGPWAAGMVAATSSAICQVGVCRQADDLPLRERLLSPLFGGGLNALMLWAAGSVYNLLGQALPMRMLDWRVLLAVLGACGTHFVLDHLGWSLWEGLRGERRAADFIKEILPYSVVMELLPLPTSVLLSQAFIVANPTMMAMAVVTLIGMGLVLRSLALSLSHERRYARDLEIINDLSRALLEARLDLDALYRLIQTFSLAITEPANLLLQVWDPREGRITTPIRHAPDEELMRATERSGLAAYAWMEDHVETVVIEGNQPHATPWETVGDEPPEHAAIHIPLVVDEAVQGVISLARREETFPQHEWEAIELVASMAAMGLRTAHAYYRERRHATQLSLIAQVSRSVAAILELDTLFADTVRLVQETFGFYCVNLFTVDEKEETITFRTSSNPEMQARGVEIPWGEGLIGHAARTGGSVLSQNVAHDARYLTIAGLEETGAELAVPLRVEQRVLGVLDIQSDRVRGLDEGDTFVMQACADQIAIAIEDSRIYESQQQQAWVATALLQVAGAVAQLTTDEEILRTIVRLTTMLVGVDRGMVFLWESDSSMFRLIEGAGFSQEMWVVLHNRVFAPDDLPVVKQAFDLRTTVQGMPPILGDNVSADIPREFEHHNTVYLPLYARGDTIGVLVAQDTETCHSRPIQSHRMTLLTGIANYAAIAMENARLYAAQREETWVSTALLQVAGLTSSPALNLDDTLTTIARLTPMLVGVEWCAILLYSEERNGFFGSRTHGLPAGALGMFDGHYYCPDDYPLLRRAMDATAPITTTTDELAHVAELAPSLGTRPLSLVALRAGERPLGLLLVGHREDCAGISDRRTSILTGIAHQTSLAIEASHLYQQTVEQDRLQHEIALASRIQESFLPECCPQIAGWQLGIEWRAARGVGGDFYDLIDLAPRKLGIVIADVSDKGVGAALYMAISHTVMRAAAMADRGPAETLRQANQVLVQDARSGMFVSMFYGIVDLDSGQLTYARAGHNPPLWVRANDRGVTPLNPAGTVLGILPDPDLVEETITLAPGDVLVTYTDGVTEAIDEHDEEYGEARLEALLQRGNHRDADALVDLIDANVRGFTGEREAFDDFTLVVLKRQG